MLKTISPPPPFSLCLKHCFSRIQPRYGKSVPGEILSVHSLFLSMRSANVSACDWFCIIRPAVTCCVRLGLSLLCGSLLYRPVFATLARCAHLIRLPLSCISAVPPALAHAWCMLVPAFCSSLPVSVWVHHSGSSGVERAEFTPYPSETAEKSIRSKWLKGFFSV